MTPSVYICCVIRTKVFKTKIHSARVYPKLVCKCRLEHDLQRYREIEDTSPVCFSALGEHNYWSSGELRVLNLLKGRIEVWMLARQCDTYCALYQLPTSKHSQSHLVLAPF